MFSLWITYSTMLCQSQNALTWLFHRMVPPSHFLCSSDSPGRQEGTWVFSFFFLGKSHFPEQLLTAEQVLAGCPGAGQQEWASPETFCFCDLPPCTRYPYPTWVSAQSYTPQTAPSNSARVGRHASVLPPLLAYHCALTATLPSNLAGFHFWLVPQKPPQFNSRSGKKSGSTELETWRAHYDDLVLLPRKTWAIRFHQGIP